MSDFSTSICWIDDSTPSRPLIDVLRERVDAECRGLRRLLREWQPDHLWGRERYWFKRMRRRTSDRDARRLICAYEDGVRRGELEVVRDRNSPFGFFVVDVRMVVRV